VSLFSSSQFRVCSVQFKNKQVYCAVIFILPFYWEPTSLKLIALHIQSHLSLFWNADMIFWVSCMCLLISLRIPGRLNDRRTPLGELNWIFTAITDTIAWNVLPRGLFWYKSSYSTISEDLVSCQSTAQTFQVLPQWVQIHFDQSTWLAQSEPRFAYLLCLFHKITKNGRYVAYALNMVAWRKYAHSVVAFTVCGWIWLKHGLSLDFKSFFNPTIPLISFLLQNPQHLKDYNKKIFKRLSAKTYIL